MNLFKSLENYGLMQHYIDFFDWIFTDKFDNSRWNNKNKIQCFTKRLYNYTGLEKKNRIYEAQNKINFPDDAKKPSFTFVCMSKGDSFGRDWIRHIRNSIAHGHCVFHICNGQYYLEMMDYSNNNCNRQTAYFFVPLTYLFQTKKDYDELDRRWEKLTMRSD